MVALREKHNGSNDDDAVELLRDVRLQPNAIPEVVSMVLQSIELATSKKSLSNSSSSTTTRSTAPSSYAAVVAPATAAKIVPIEKAKRTSTEEYDRDRLADHAWRVRKHITTITTCVALGREDTTPLVDGVGGGPHRALTISIATLVARPFGPSVAGHAVVHCPHAAAVDRSSYISIATLVARPFGPSVAGHAVVHCPHAAAVDRSSSSKKSADATFSFVPPNASPPPLHSNLQLAGHLFKDTVSVTKRASWPADSALPSFLTD